MKSGRIMRIWAMRKGEQTAISSGRGAVVPPSGVVGRVDHGMALHHVGNVNPFPAWIHGVSRKVGGRENLIQELSGGSDKGFPFSVFGVPGAFPDEQDAGGGVAHAESQPDARGPRGHRLAIADVVPQKGQSVGVGQRRVVHERGGKRTRGDRGRRGQNFGERSEPRFVPGRKREFFLTTVRRSAAAMWANSSLGLSVMGRDSLQ
jgi:hypothetical protein